MNTFTHPFGISNFGDWLKRFKCVAVTGDHESPRFAMTDYWVNEAFAFLASLNKSHSGKADFIHIDLLGEGDPAKAVALFDAIANDDLVGFKRKHVLDLIENGGHAPMLCELAFGPDRRMSKADMDNETWKRRMEA
jgi:hypothetical protein